MRVVLLLWMAIFPVFGWTQIDSPLPYKPLHADLFRRAQSSELIAIVKVVEGRGVGTQISTEELMRLGDISKAYGGSLYVLQVAEILCAKTDFDPKAAKAHPTPEKIMVFKDRARIYEGGYYQVGQRYLVFLTQHPEQKDLATRYRLEAGTIYYEAFEGERGLIPLSAQEPPEIAKIRQFCRAVRPTDPKVKIRRLTKLLGSGDAALDSAVNQAIDLFHQQMLWR